MGTVLVVDDDEATAHFIAIALRDQCYRVLHAVDGPSLGVALRQQPDAILLDLRMPAMDSDEVSRRLRADPVTAHIPIIVMSAMDTNSALRQYPHLIADDWLPKPFDIEDLYAVIDRWEMDGGLLPTS